MRYFRHAPRIYDLRQPGSAHPPHSAGVDAVAGSSATGM